MREAFLLFMRFMRQFRLTRRLPLLCLVFGGVSMSLLELLGIFIFMSLMSLIYRPEMALENPILRPFCAWLGFEDSRSMVIILGGLVACIFIFKSLFQIFYLRFEFSVLTKWRIHITNFFFQAYLQAPYELHLKKDTPQLISLIVGTIPSVINAFIHQMVVLFHLWITGFLILGYLLYQYSHLFIILTVIGGILLWSHSLFLNKRMQRIGQQNQSLAMQQQAALQQSFAGYKDMHIHLKARYFGNLFTASSTKLSFIQENMFFYQSLPPVSIELITMLLVLFVFELAMFSSAESGTAFVQMSTFVFVALRLTPILNRSVGAIASVNNGKEAVISLLKEADELSLYNSSNLFLRDLENLEPLPFENALVLKNINYTYPKVATPTFTDLTFQLKKGEFIGLTGPSGGGKTTLVAILLGFLIPQKGSFSIDETLVTPQNIQELRSMMGYVDQKIFLMNSTIAENVAFGVELENIDEERMKIALQKAQLWDFVSTLPLQLKTPIGENGKLLSGGQQQRLAIARALYKKLKILILDEASAALDVETERGFFEFLYTLKGDLTVLMIAHRLTTLRHCDRVLFMEQGQVKGEGTFQELKESFPPFREYLAYYQLEQSPQKLDE